MDKLKIKEAIVVEGRDDTAAVQKAVEALIIETHGYGISKKTWELLEKADKEKGLIIFTDPDYSGEEIRRRITAKFPNSKHAYMPRKKATKKDDIGIENASPEAILEALSKIAYTKETQSDFFTMVDMDAAGLVGNPKAKENREFLGTELGIGYGNSSAFLKKLNRFGIDKQRFWDAVKKMREE